MLSPPLRELKDPYRSFNAFKKLETKVYDINCCFVFLLGDSIFPFQHAWECVLIIQIDDTVDSELGQLIFWQFECLKFG